MLTVTLLSLCHLRRAGSLSGHHCHTGAAEGGVSQVSPHPALHQHNVPRDFLLEEASLSMCSCINSLGRDPWAHVRNVLINRIKGLTSCSGGKIGGPFLKLLWRPLVVLRH